MLQYRRYRAPANHGETFWDPPRQETLAVLAGNVELRRGWSLELGGTDLAALATGARRELVRLATEYTRQYRDVPATELCQPDRPLILSGHQPEWFHPGVWYKNGVLDRLAQAVHGVAIHWIIDSDLGESARIVVPAGSVSDPRLDSVLYDRPLAGCPFEDRPLADRELFRGFGSEVQRRIEPLVADPLVRGWWPSVVEISRKESNLGRIVAQGRHQLEGGWGLKTLELPLGVACETEPFRRFVWHLVTGMPRLQSIHNAALSDYRRVNRVRGRANPVPPLERAEEWYEVPLWLWTRQDPRRRRLFVRQREGVFELGDLGGQRYVLGRRSDDAVSELERLAGEGVRVRPRVLVTTWYARLVLCDLFVHGIGGGKYDQLTDEIVRRWLGIEMPRFQVVTATAQLPIPRDAPTADELRAVERALRDLTFNPDRYLGEDSSGAALIAEKRNWLTQQLARGAGRARHRAIARINSSLQPLVANRRAELDSKRDSLARSLRHQRLLGSREFAFCLHPEPRLRGLLLDNA